MICNICLKEFTPKVKWQKRCSNSCRWKDWSKDRHRNLKNYVPQPFVKVVCEYCSSEYMSRMTSQKFCSDRCRQANYEMSHPDRNRNPNRIKTSVKKSGNEYVEEALEFLHFLYPEKNEVQLLEMLEDEINEVSLNAV